MSINNNKYIACNTESYMTESNSYSLGYCIWTASMIVHKEVLNYFTSSVYIYFSRFPCKLTIYDIVSSGADPGGPWGPRPPDHQKWGPSTKSLQNWGPRMAVLGPKIIFFFQKFLPCFAQHKLLTSNYLYFFQDHYACHCLMHICIHESLHFIFIGSYKLYIIKCTFIMNIALWFLCIIDWYLNKK